MEQSNFPIKKATATIWCLKLFKQKERKIFDTKDLFITSEDVSGKNVEILGQITKNDITYHVYRCHQ